jgi:hypothetical protein
MITRVCVDTYCTVVNIVIYINYIEEIVNMIIIRPDFKYINSNSFSWHQLFCCVVVKPFYNGENFILSSPTLIRSF